MKSQSLVKEICPTTTQQRVKEGALLVDVRERDEVAELSYDVPHIINIPLSEFEERYHEVPNDKEVIMVCKNGSRSLRAAGFLVNHGYSKVVNMEKGIIRWVEKGFPTKGDTSGVILNASSGDCCTTTVEKENINLNDLGKRSDRSEPNCC